MPAGSSEEKEREIYKLLEKEGPLTLKQIAQKTGLTPYRVEYYLHILLAKHLITAATWKVYKIRR